MSTAIEEILESLRYVAGLVGNDYYSEFSEHMKQVQELATDPEYVNNPINNYAVQEAISEALAKVDPLVTEGRRLAGGKDEDLLVQAHRNRLLASGYREIADGLAWRTMGFDRARLRILAEAQSPGLYATPNGSKSGRAAEFRIARNVVNNGNFVLMHDVTNQLTLGDLSSIDAIGDVPKLAEIKKTKVITAPSIMEKVEKGHPLSAQEHRLIQAQIMLFNDQIGLGDKKIPIRRVEIPVQTFHDDVRKLLKEARKAGVAQTQPAPYLSVMAVDLSNKNLHMGSMEGIPDPFQDHKLVKYTNYQMLDIKKSGQVVRGKAPYTIYPYDNADQVDIMTGRIYLHTDLSIDELQKSMNALGWKLEINIPDDYSPDKVNPFGGVELFKGMETADRFVRVSNIETGYSFQIGMEFLSMIGIEFMTIEDVLAPYKSHMVYTSALGIYRPKPVFQVNDGEKSIWR